MYEYRVTLDRIVDGDTIDVNVDLGFTVWLSKQRIRLMGVDTWESRTRNLEVKAKGLLAKEFTKHMVSEVICDGVSLNDALVENGHAVEYYGGTKTLKS